MKKKILLFVLAFAMIFTSIVSVAHAEETGTEEPEVECDCPVHNPNAKVPSTECANAERVVNIASEATMSIVSGGKWMTNDFLKDMIDGDWHHGTLSAAGVAWTEFDMVFSDTNYVTDINFVVNSFGTNLRERPNDAIPIPNMTEQGTFNCYVTLFTYNANTQQNEVIPGFDAYKLEWTADQQVVTLDGINSSVSRVLVKYGHGSWQTPTSYIIWEIEIFSTEVSHIWELDNTDTAPTCTVDGVGDYVCMCGVRNENQPIPAIGHEAGEEYYILPGTPAVEDDPATEGVDETAAAVPSKHYNLCTREGCDEKMNISGHDWTHACDVKCDKCGETRTSDEAHAYEKADCQTKCDNCDFVRTDATVPHTYEHDCDASCEECDEIRVTAGHQYTDCEDTECNVTGCGETRTAPGHTWDNACDNECNACGAANPDYVAGHSYDNCDDTVCNECEFTRTAVAHIYDNCDDTQCNTCGMTRTAVAHVYDNACDATCNNCTVTRTPADHVYDNACDATCNVCGAARTPAAHVYDNDCDKTCNVCNAERTVADHVYGDWAENEEGYYERACSICGVKETGEKAGLGGGAIAGIVIGSVAVVGGGGFAAWWFIFKKKVI